MRVATEHVRRMQGGAQSHLMRCDDGAYYIVKFQNNPQHLRVLANEMLATRLAARLGLCVPQVEVVDVCPEIIAYTSDLVIQLRRGRTPCSSGKQFGSQFPGCPGSTTVYDFLPDEQFGAVCNIADFLGIFVFDKWTCNTDKRQAIFIRQSDTGTIGPSGKEFRAMMIDQGFCFNGGNWNFPDAPLHSLYTDRHVYDSIVGIESFNPWLEWLEEQLTLEMLYEEAQEVPPEWSGEQDEAWKHLIERLYLRRTRVRELICSARNADPGAFPSWSRRVFCKR